MNIVVNVLVIGIACFAAYLVYVLAAQALRNFSLFNSRRAVPFAVAMLTFLSIEELGRGIILLLLIPYAALGITLVLLYLICLFAATTNGKKLPTVGCWYQAFRRIGRACVRRIREEAANLWPR